VRGVHKRGIRCRGADPAKRAAPDAFGNSRHKAELRLWQGFARRGFRGLQVRATGADRTLRGRFVCREHMLIVEADGGQHLDSNHGRHTDKCSAIMAYRVLRFWNNNILANIEGRTGDHFGCAALRDSTPADTPPHPDR